MCTRHTVCTHWHGYVHERRCPKFSPKMQAVKILPVYSLDLYLYHHKGLPRIYSRSITMHITVNACFQWQCWRCHTEDSIPRTILLKDLNYYITHDNECYTLFCTFSKMICLQYHSVPLAYIMDIGVVMGIGLARRLATQSFSQGFLLADEVF